MEGGGGVKHHRALVPRLAGPVLKQILPAALPVASHGGARGLGRRGRGWVGAVKAREGVDWERTAMGGRAGADWGRRRRRRRGGGGGVGRGSARVDLVARERGSKGIWREGGRIARGRVLMAHRPVVRHKYDYSNGAPPLGAPLEFCFNLAH